jgi:AraC family transcriptional regulator
MAIFAERMGGHRSRASNGGRSVTAAYAHAVDDPQMPLESSLPLLDDRGKAGQIAWDRLAPRPYELSFANSTDVICLLFGTIEARTGYDGARPTEMRFESLSASFHPGGGEVVVKANRVCGGFVAFTFPLNFRDMLFGDDVVVRGVDHSVHSILSPAIASLVTYARTALGPSGATNPSCMEALGGLAYIEALKGLDVMKERANHLAFSEQEMRKLVDYVKANLDQPLSHEALAKVVGLPIATLRRRFQRKNGLPLHQFVLEHRLAAARDKLSATDLSLCSIANACGFSSQQHMTTVFTKRLGLTPGDYRQSYARRPAIRA